MKPRKRLKTLKKHWSDAGLKAAHFEKAKATAEKNRVYCVKEGDFKEWGEASKQGKRTDLVALRTLAEEGASFLEMAMAQPDAHAKYHAWAAKVSAAAKSSRVMKKRKLALFGGILRPWQRQVMIKLAVQSMREVLWVWEEGGGVGKTWLAKYLLAKQDAFLVTGGKHADIAYAYGSQELVVFDLCREKADTVPYAVMESFKNGMLFSPKYESMVKHFDPAKVVVFANYPPEREKMSADRWVVMHLAVPREEAAADRV